MGCKFCSKFLITTVDTFDKLAHDVKEDFLIACTNMCLILCIKINVDLYVEIFICTVISRDVFHILKKFMYT